MARRRRFGRWTFGAAFVIAAIAVAALLVRLVPTAVPVRPPNGEARVAPPPPPPWTGSQLHELIAAIRASAAEGLTPADYDLAALDRVVAAGGSPAGVDALANRAAEGLAHDYAAGRIRNRHRFNWYIPFIGPSPVALAKGILKARPAGTLRDWLDGLLPNGPDYAALRRALAGTSTTDVERRNRIRANMERWRWLPRGFGGGDMLYVNLPTYRLDVIQDGERTARYKAVIGAVDMPTPVLTADVHRIVANPDWIVPRSIVLKSHLRPGAASRYEFSTRPDGSLRVRQKPGPGNALGKVKIEFPNPLAIYFHDTPSRSLFGQDVRAFSHGCVRVQHVDALASSLVADPDRFSEALAGDQTRSFAPDRRWRAVIVYLTLAIDADGNLVDVGDPYRLDEPMAAALDGRKTLPPVPRPSAPTSAIHAAVRATSDPDDAIDRRSRIEALNVQL